MPIKVCAGSELQVPIICTSWATSLGSRKLHRRSENRHPVTNVQATMGYQKPLFLLIGKGPHPVLTSWGSAHPAQPGPIHSNMSQIRVFQLKLAMDFPKDLGHQHTIPTATSRAPC